MDRLEGVAVAVLPGVQVAPLDLGVGGAVAVAVQVAVANIILAVAEHHARDTAREVGEVDHRGAGGIEAHLPGDDLALGVVEAAAVEVAHLRAPWLVVSLQCRWFPGLKQGLFWPHPDRRSYQVSAAKSRAYTPQEGSTSRPSPRGGMPVAVSMISRVGSLALAR